MKATTYYEDCGFTTSSSEKFEKVVGTEMKKETVVKRIQFFYIMDRKPRYYRILHKESCCVAHRLRVLNNMGVGIMILMLR